MDNNDPVINYRHQSKMSSSKKITCKGTYQLMKVGRGCWVCVQNMGFLTANTALIATSSSLSRSLFSPFVCYDGGLKNGAVAYVFSMTI
jgi:hypothetical protein